MKYLFLLFFLPFVAFSQTYSEDTNSPIAQNKLAIYFYNKSDFENALIWFKKSSDQGFAEAQYNLASMYENGVGTIKNLNKAIFWYRKAAGQNS